VCDVEGLSNDRHVEERDMSNDSDSALATSRIDDRNISTSGRHIDLLTV